MPDISPQPSQSKSPTIPFLVRFIATGFWAGYSPFVPGTIGSLVGLILYYIPGMEISLVLLSICIISFFLGSYLSDKMEKEYGEDPPIVVIDEIVGMWISLLFVPKILWTALTAFFLFRFFDIVKPPPARYVERYRMGVGIMLDDVVAGIYANISLQIILLFFPTIK